MGSASYQAMLLEAMEITFDQSGNACQVGDARMAGISMGQYAQGVLANKPKSYFTKGFEQFLTKKRRILISYRAKHPSH